MGKIIIILFSIFFLLFIPFQLWLESHNYSDSLGLWYTIYSSVLYAGIITAILTPIIYLLRKHKTKAPRRKMV